MKKINWVNSVFRSRLEDDKSTGLMAYVCLFAAMAVIMIVLIFLFHFL